MIASPIRGPEGNREFLVHLGAGPVVRGDRRPDRGGGRRGVGGRVVNDRADRVRLQPDERGGARAARAGRGLVPGARHRRLGRRRPATTTACWRELPTTDVLVVLGGDGTFLRAARAVTEVDVPHPGHQPGQGRLPVQGRGRTSSSRSSAKLVDRRASRSASGWPSRAAILRRPAARPTSQFTRPQRRRDRARLAGPRRPAGRRRSTTRTWPRSSPTAWSSPARPARPATRSRPAARSSIRAAATSS